MKHKVYLPLLFMCFSLAAQAQDSYHPFVAEGKVWNTTIEELPKPYQRTYQIVGDTIINTKKYAKVYLQDPKKYGDSSAHYYCSVREEGKKVYRVISEEYEESLLYNFDMRLREKYILNFEGEFFPNLKDDTIAMSVEMYGLYIPEDMLPIRWTELSVWNDDPRRETLHYAEWLEGIGNIFAPFSNELGYYNREYLNTCIENGKVIYDEERGYEHVVIETTWVDPDGIETPTSFRKEGVENRMFDIQGRLIRRNPERGIYIQRGKKYIVR